MAKTLKSDRILFLTTVLLVCTSLVMVYSASAALGSEKPFNDPAHFLTRQALWILLGFALLVVTMRVNYRSYRSDAFVWGVLGVVGVMLVAVLFWGPLIKGSRRWLAVWSFGIQPSELAKLACVLFTALMLERRAERMHEFRHAIAPILLVVGPLVGLVLLEPDYGTSVTILGIATIMLFGAGIKYAHLLAGAVLAIPLAAAAAWSRPEAWERLEAYWDPWAHAEDAGFQTVQSLLAVGGGGVTGKGLMAGVQKLFWLPEAHNDFIYAVIGEELGLLGATLVLVCFGVIAWRGLHIASRAEDMFGSFVALGITAMIAAQAFVNMSVVLGLLPTKGIPLPLVSAGGSSMLVSLVGMGVLLNISQHEAPGR